MKVELKEGERVDDLHRNGFQIIQNGKLFCFGMDAVLLSGFAKVKAQGTALDLGTGTGIIPILLAAKTQGRHFTGLEISPTSADMAARSVLLNDLQERVEIVRGDIKEAGELFAPASFDTVTSNPPYMIGHVRAAVFFWYTGRFAWQKLSAHCPNIVWNLSGCSLFILMWTVNQIWC